MRRGSEKGCQHVRPGDPTVDIPSACGMVPHEEGGRDGGRQAPPARLQDSRHLLEGRGSLGIITLSLSSIEPLSLQEPGKMTEQTEPNPACVQMRKRCPPLARQSPWQRA